MKLTESYIRKLIIEELSNEQPQSPQRKDLEAFQQRQTQVSSLTKEIVAQKVQEYLSTLRGVDIDRQKQIIIDGLLLTINNLKNPVKQPTAQLPVAKVKPQ